MHRKLDPNDGSNLFKCFRLNSIFKHALKNDSCKRFNSSL